MTTAIELSGVSVEFRHFDSISRSFKARLRSPDGGEFWEKGAAHRGEIETNRTIALKNVNLVVGGSERVAVIGGNASGKTTLIRVAGGLLKPNRGDVVHHVHSGVAMEIGVGFDLDLSVLDTLYLQGMLLAKDKDAVAEFVHQTVEYGELADFLEMPLRVLPPGRRGRLALSMAIGADPGLLLFDEIFESVDPEFVAKVFDTIRTRECAMLAVVRQRALLDSICDGAIVLEHGEIIDGGPCAEITEKYQGKYVY